MKKSRVLCMLLSLALLLLFPLRVSADTGPKPTTHIKVTEEKGKPIIVTLLAEADRSGPHNIIGKDETPESWWDDLTEIEAKAWETFRDYEDPDGFHFWGEIYWNDVDWNYYPPEVFKLAVYYPYEDILLISEETYERYAFDSNYTLFLSDVDYSSSGTMSMKLEQAVDTMGEGFGFLTRVLLTLAIEIGIALLWGYRKKDQLLTLLIVNVVTQLGLNLLLWIWYFFDGRTAAMLRLILAEIVVLVIETLIYSRTLPREDRKTPPVFWYTLIANLVSCSAGWLMLN